VINEQLALINTSLQRGGCRHKRNPNRFSGFSGGRTFPFLLLVLSAALSAVAQETVTIPKSRLEELQRKEAELDSLKGDLKATKGENLQLKKQHQEDAIKISSAPPAQAVVTHVSPPMASLPPLTTGEIVDAMDLANYYRADAAAADHRFRKQMLRVLGEISAFEKPPFIRDYRILLKTADREIRLVCDMNPPEQYDAMFTVKHGSELVGQMSGRNRVPIAKVGDKVIIEGQCRGLTDGTVKLSGCEFKLIH
jgi:hypothetical protein